MKAAAAVLAALLVAMSASAVDLKSDPRLVLQAGTPVSLLTLAPLSSKRNRQGDRFELEVREDVTVGGRVAIPRGAKAFGEIARHTPKGSYGRAGKLELRLLHVTVDGRNIRLDGNPRREGADATGPAIATGLVWGAIGAFISGKNAVLPAGTEIVGYVHRDVPLIAAD